MAGDIVVPKRTVSSFAVGVVATLIVLALVGAGAAVYYAGTQNIDLENNGKVINLAAPTASTDAATKGYVDALTTNSSWQTVNLTACNGNTCFYPNGSMGWDALMASNLATTADEVCIIKGYEYASSYGYSTSASISACVYWTGGTWSNQGCGGYSRKSKILYGLRRLREVSNDATPPSSHPLNNPIGL